MAQLRPPILFASVVMLTPLFACASSHSTSATPSTVDGGRCAVGEFWCAPCGGALVAYCAPEGMICTGLCLDAGTLPEPTDSTAEESACDPLNADSCGVGQGCYFVDESTGFRCMLAGTVQPEQECTQPNDCMAGYLCVHHEFNLRVTRCYQACDPETDDGICGGRCDPMSAHGYDVPTVGFCYFLGG